jgi:hypothetical protein
MFSLFNRRTQQKSKRQKIAEHAAMLAFLRDPKNDDIHFEYARVIGEDSSRCVVEIGYGDARPPERRFFSVADATCIVTPLTMKEVVEQWSVEYER